MSPKKKLFTTVLFAASWASVDAQAKDADGTGVAGDQFGASVATGDFDDDGFSDLVVGVPFDNSGVVGVNGGAINVMYGGGYTTSKLPENYYFEYTSPQFFHTGKAAGDQFGHAVAVGDFNDDDYDDIAVGAPMDDIGAAADAGSVEVFYGSGTGPVAPGQVWTQNTVAVSDASESGDHFGFALATGDFNCDGISDLAIGVPDEGTASTTRSGKVQVLYGSSPAGLITPDAAFDQAALGSIESYDLFGFSLAAGNFDQAANTIPHCEDLAVGVPYENLGTAPAFSEAGGVNVFYGTSTGLSPTSGDQWFTQDTSGIAGTAQSFDYFGWALTAVDFDDDLFDDLAIGVPGEASLSGGAHIIYSDGSSAGLNATGDAYISSPGPGSWFGRSLTAGDFDDDGKADLAVGMPLNSVSGTEYGGVVVYYTGSTTVGQYWDGLEVSCNGRNSASQFGGSLAAGNFDDDDYDDLVIGVPNDVYSVRSGTVCVVPGDAAVPGGGLNGSDSVLWRQ